MVRILRQQLSNTFSPVKETLNAFQESFEPFKVIVKPDSKLQAAVQQFKNQFTPEQSQKCDLFIALIQSQKMKAKENSES